MTRPPPRGGWGTGETPFSLPPPRPDDDGQGYEQGKWSDPTVTPAGKTAATAATAKMAGSVGDGSEGMDREDRYQRFREVFSGPRVGVGIWPT